MREASSSKSTSPPVIVVLQPDPGRKSSHLALVTHRGGGWYDVQCMGAAKRCQAGECKHTAGMSWARSKRPFRQVPRSGVRMEAENA